MIAIVGSIIGIIQAKTPTEAAVSQVVAFIGLTSEGSGFENGDVEMVWPVTYFGDGVANGGIDFDFITVRKESSQALGSYIREVEDAVKTRAIELDYELTNGVRASFETFEVP